MKNDFIYEQYSRLPASRDTTPSVDVAMLVAGHEIGVARLKREMAHPENGLSYIDLLVAGAKILVAGATMLVAGLENRLAYYKKSLAFVKMLVTGTLMLVAGRKMLVAYNEKVLAFLKMGLAYIVLRVAYGDLENTGVDEASRLDIFRLYFDKRGCKNSPSRNDCEIAFGRYGRIRT